MEKQDENRKKRPLRKWKDLSDREKDDIVKTEPNKAYFWSGNTDSANHFERKGEDKFAGCIGGEKNARRIAQENGGETLEMKLGKANIDAKSMKSEDWNDASCRFAKKSSGKVHVIKGDDVNLGSVYNTREQQEIENNRKITGVDEIDNVSGKNIKASYERNSKTGKFEDSHGIKFNDSRYDTLLGNEYVDGKAPENPKDFKADYVPQKEHSINSKIGKSVSNSSAKNRDSYSRNNSEAGDAGGRWSSVGSSEEYNEKYNPELTSKNNEYSQEYRSNEKLVSDTISNNKKQEFAPKDDEKNNQFRHM